MIEIKFTGDSMQDIYNQTSDFISKYMAATTPVEPAPAPAPTPTPAPAPAPAPAPTGVPELDATGMPWDARIHTKKKTTLAKTGTWKLTRGVNKDLVAAVQAETPPVIAVVPETAPPVTPVETVVPVEFQTVNAKFIELMTNGKVDIQKMAEILQVHNVASMSELATQPQEVIATVYTALCSIV